uniref:hypothetical protein n=1 Tax=Micrococcus luteus TaxID=1270 RepID=UPI00301A65CC
LSRVLWKVRSKAPTVTASVSKMVVATGEGYTTIRDSTRRYGKSALSTLTGTRSIADDNQVYA